MFQRQVQPRKCVFRVPSGKLLSLFIIFENGIEANPDKILVILKIGLIDNLKGAQRLTGCLATLNLFISRFGQ